MPALPTLNGDPVTYTPGRAHGHDVERRNNKLHGKSSRITRRRRVRK